MKEIEKDWINVGYQTFAYDGPNSLKIERIAKDVGKNKSSFYHLFADLELFIQSLLSYHIDQAIIIAEKETNALSEEELIDILISHKVDLLFNRQLRIHRDHPEFSKCLARINQLTIPALLPLWKKIIGLEDNSYLAEMVLSLSIENFYLQCTDLTLNENWLSTYFKDIRMMITHFKQNNVVSTLDGSV